VNPSNHKVTISNNSGGALYAALSSLITAIEGLKYGGSGLTYGSVALEAVRTTLGNLLE
jgi:hypothetical protein